MRSAIRTPSRVGRRLRRAVASCVALVGLCFETGGALGSERQQRGAGQAASLATPSRIELCFVEPVDEQLRRQIVQQLHARLEAQRWTVSHSSETATAAGLARLRDAAIDLGLLLEAHGELLRVHVLEPRERRSVIREIGGVARDAAASEAVVNIAASAMETARMRILDAQTPAPDPPQAPPDPPASGERRLVDAPPTPRMKVSDVTASPDALASTARWGLGIGADVGALSRSVGWSAGPLLTGHVFWGHAPLSGELRVHATHHLAQTIEAGVGSFDWSRTLLGVNAGPTWWLTRHASVGAEVGLEGERAMRSRVVAQPGAEGLPGQPRHRGAARVNLIGTLLLADELGLRLGAGIQWWVGESRYVASNGDVLLALPRLNGTASLGMVWRAP